MARSPERFVALIRRIISRPGSAAPSAFNSVLRFRMTGPVPAICIGRDASAVQFEYVTREVERAADQHASRSFERRLWSNKRIRHTVRCHHVESFRANNFAETLRAEGVGFL